MNPQEEKWKDEIMNSLQGMKAAEPNPFLFAKINRRIHEKAEEQLPVWIRGKSLALVLAAIALLLSLNFLAISTLNEQSVDVAQVGTDNHSYSLVYEDNLTIYQYEAGSTF